MNDKRDNCNEALICNEARPLPADVQAEHITKDELSSVGSKDPREATIEEGIGNTKATAEKPECGSNSANCDPAGMISSLDTPASNQPREDDLSQNLQRPLHIRQNTIKEWHEEISKIQEGLLALKPIASDLLRSTMTFTDQFINSFIINSAKMQIELYDLIADGYRYHSIASQNAPNGDYKKSVANYICYMDSIEDTLSAFGIETIRSNPGDSFDGAIHSASDQRFNPRTATINKSLRCGFRYKDTILQKEIVTLKET